jgi:hypothetical protein
MHKRTSLEQIDTYHATMTFSLAKNVVNKAVFIAASLKRSG